MEVTTTINPENPNPKRFKHQTRDRLSELPDLALVHIISHLYIEESVRTTVLSKRFNSLWKSVSILNFYDRNSPKTGFCFTRVIDSALKSHCRKEIDKFSLTLMCGSRHYDRVDDWVEFAVLKRVKSLCLDLNQGNERKLPEFVCINDDLVELTLCCCRFSKKIGILWNSLRKLSISRVKTSEELISRVLSGCRVLETLELKEWSGFDKLKVDSSSSLRVLRVVDEVRPTYMANDSELEISGPNLVVLEVSGVVYRVRVRVRDVGCLVDARMGFDVRPKKSNSSAWCVVRDQDLVREVLECVCFVKALTLGEWCIKAVSTCEAYNLPSPWSERQSLTLCIPVISWDHRGIASLLHSSPQLETLAIRLSYCSDMVQCFLEHTSSNTSDEEYYWKSWNTIYKCSLLHLRTVKIYGFQESCKSMKPLFQFMEFLLRNSRALEEIIIHASKFVTQGTLNEALKLLSIPTASPDAIVQFEPLHLWVDPFCKSQKVIINGI